MKCWFPRGIKIITCASFNHIQLLLSTSRHYAYQRWHSHLGQLCHCQPNSSIFTSPILCNSRIYHLQCSSSQGKELSQPTPHWLIPPLSHVKYLVAYTNMPMCFYTIVSMHNLELEKVKGPSSFYLGHFFLSKIFHHITEDANILLPKLGGKCKLNYFPISTPSKHTSHHHDRSIVSCRFLTYIYGRPPIGGRL